MIVALKLTDEELAELLKGPIDMDPNVGMSILGMLSKAAERPFEQYDFLLLGDMLKAHGTPGRMQMYRVDKPSLERKLSDLLLAR